MIVSLLAIALAQAAALNIGKSVPLRPNGYPGNWVTNDDYPEAARRAGVQGVVSFRLLVNQLGTVEACTIVESSGSVILDTQTCDVLKARARFFPAQGEDGKPVVANYSGRFRWTIAQTDRRDLPVIGSVGVAYIDILRVVIDDKGRVAECVLAAPKDIPAGTGPCAAISASPPIKPYTDANGRPIRKTIIIKREVELKDE